MANDVVFTSKEAVKDILEHFDRGYHIYGSVLDPFKGDGVFFDMFPKVLRERHNRYDWCEILAGRDFFNASGHFDFIISNPPYSTFTKVLAHSLDIADNIIYLIPVNKLTSSAGRVRRLFEWGGIPEIRIYEPRSCNFRFGFALGAVYMKRGYRGKTAWSFGLATEEL